MENGRNEYDDAYDDGYKHGKNDYLLEQFVNSITKGISGTDSKDTDSYNKGYDDGASDRGDDGNSNYSGRSDKDD